MLVYINGTARRIDADQLGPTGEFVRFEKSRTEALIEQAARGGIWPFNWSRPEREVQVTKYDLVTLIATRLIDEIAPAPDEPGDAQ